MLLCLAILLTGCRIQQEPSQPVASEEMLDTIPEANPTITEAEPEEVFVPAELLAVSVPAVADVFKGIGEHAAIS